MPWDKDQEDCSEARVRTDLRRLLNRLRDKAAFSHLSEEEQAKLRAAKALKSKQYREKNTKKSKKPKKDKVHSDSSTGTEKMGIGEDSDS